MAHDALLFGPNAVVQPSVFGINEYSGAPVERPLPSQVAGFGPAEMMNFMTAMMAENERLRTESMKRPRTEKDEEEEGEPPIKIHIVEGYDDAWSTVHHVSRNLRPYCGDWNERFKSLGKKAKPEKKERQASAGLHHQVRAQALRQLQLHRRVVPPRGARAEGQLHFQRGQVDEQFWAQRRSRA